MNIKENGKEFLIVILASVILALTISFSAKDMLSARDMLPIAFLSILIVIGINVLTKKIIGYNLETKVVTKFWSLHYYGFRKDSHFKKPLPMLWLPLIISLLTKGILWWFPILEFDVASKAERVSRRHGLYRFTEVTEWHMGLIAIGGIIANLVLAVIGYLAGFEFFAKLSIYYALWSILPISSLDGSKIFFASRGLWLTLLIIALIFFGWGLMIV